MFSILVDIFYPSVGTVFSKEGVFQQPLVGVEKVRDRKELFAAIIAAIELSLHFS
jgi:hypothetical protein